MDFFSFLFGVIIFYTVVSIATVFLGVRFAVRGARRLMGKIRENRRLIGQPSPPPSPARDVVVESVEPPSAQESWQPTDAGASHGDYVRLDVDNGTRSDDIAVVMRRYVDDAVVGSYAQAVIETLSSADLRQRAMLAELEGTFRRGSLSWEKFYLPTTAALDAITRNCASLANRIQSFDSAGYLRLKREVDSDMNKGFNGGVGTRGRRWRLQGELLASMNQVLDANESLLYELDKLSSEISVLSDTDYSDASEKILEEIRRLVDEAKYYR